MLSPGTLLEEVTRVVSAHLALHEVSIDSVRDAVVHTAARVKAGLAGPSTTSLAEKLQTATGYSIAELARAAETWRPEPSAS
jgi:hypothetical protein